MRRLRPGFTLIELLIVLVLVAILASIGLSRFWVAKDRALVSSMQGDLRTLALHQELYFDLNMSYAGALTDLSAFQPSPGIDVAITHAASSGWAAAASHPGIPQGQCAYFTGEVPAGAGDPASEPGMVYCDI